MENSYSKILSLMRTQAETVQQGAFIAQVKSAEPLLLLAGGAAAGGNMYAGTGVGTLEAGDEVLAFRIGGRTVIAAKIEACGDGRG